MTYVDSQGDQRLDSRTTSTLAEGSRLGQALADANIPTLLMVLYHLTGDDVWLSARYAPTRSKGLDDNDTGGLAPQLQDEIRAAAQSAVVDYEDGVPPARPVPTANELHRMMEVCVGSEVPESYPSMMLEEMGFVEKALPRAVQESDDPSTVEVLIIGAGISGIACAKTLTDIGVPYTIFERNQDIGGTWMNNVYPGCSVDTPSYLYSFTFSPKNWPRYFARQPEVLSYLRDVADQFGVRSHIEFGVEVVDLTWDEQKSFWRVTVRDEHGTVSTTTANCVITAVGQLNRPSTPTIPGADTFAGTSFHSSEWPEGFSAAGKRVAVIGTGASAMQLVPAIADSVEHMTVIQRSAQWVAPNPQHIAALTDERIWLFENLPFYRQWYRFRLAFAFNDKIYPSLLVDEHWPHPERSINKANDRHREFLTGYITSEIGDDTELLADCLPDYPPYGKRMLIDQGWFSTLRKPNVELLTDSVVEITPTGIRTASGAVREVDVIIYATGFHARKLLHPMSIQGTGSTDLSAAWGEDDARAYLGITVPDFPNLFFMYGPNTNLGHGGSFIFLAESQSRYIGQAITTLIRRGAGALSCRPDRYAQYNNEVDTAHSTMIWSHKGMDTWYRNAKGRVVTNMPWRVVDYWHLTRKFRSEDFDWSPALAEQRS